MSRREYWRADDMVTEQNVVNDEQLVAAIQWWCVNWDLERAADRLIAAMILEVNV